LCSSSSPSTSTVGGVGHGPAAGLELLAHCQPMGLLEGGLGCLRPGRS
jgi:hypothetical protein